MNRGFTVIMMLGMTLATAGCSSEYNLATGREESLMYGTEKEVNLGDAAAQQLEKEFKINQDLDVNARVQQILDRLVVITDRKDIVYTVRVIEDDKVNAVSLPGGYIYVFKGLLDKIKSDDQLAGVMAHEMGHITARHGVKRLQSAYGLTLLQVASIASGNGNVAAGMSTITATIFYAYSRQDELEADRLAVKYVQKAGYDPQGVLQVLEILRKEQERAPSQQLSYFRTHPYLPERIAMVNQTINGKVGFKDYLNLTGSDR